MGIVGIDTSFIFDKTIVSCGTVSMVIDKNSFDCTNLGTQQVRLILTEKGGLKDTCFGLVTIEDTINPTAITQNITVQLDTNGNASITPNMVNNNSSDNCSIASSSIDITDFTCADLGNNTVTLTVTDDSNNSDTETAIITVQDMINPTVVTQNITIQFQIHKN